MIHRPRLLYLLAVACAAPALRAVDTPHEPPRHVVVVVFDGMRPDFVTAETTPHLWALASQGVFFAAHHPVYLSSTEVNGTAIATGMYPAHSGVISNVDFRPGIDPQKTVAIEAEAVVRRGDLVSGGHYLGAPTVAEILHGHGIPTLVTGAKQVAILHDRAARAGGPGTSPVLFAGATQPEALAASLRAELGGFPADPADGDGMPRDAWTTSAVTGPLWRDGVPAYTLLWLAEPDFSQHAAGPGSAQALAAIRDSDEQLGRVLAELDRRGLRASTDVFVVSDHGFSTISRKVDVAVELSKAGFDAGRAALGGLKPGQVLVVANGGSSLFYVGAHDAAVVSRLAEYLQRQDWTGVVLSRGPLEGTFPFSEARIDSPEAPDLVASYHWSVAPSATGAPGLQTSDMSPSSKRVGQHASLSAYDMHNTLVAAGPDLRRGIVDTLPTGNTDLAPTILWILGLRPEASHMDGRVLGEALASGGPVLTSHSVRRLSASRTTQYSEWHQYLQVSEVNGVRYLDEGNGECAPGDRK